MKKYSFNEHYFDKINTEDKAYFLGLLYADGCNVFTKNIITISLQAQDVHILESFVDCVEFTGPLLFRNRVKLHHKDSYILNLNSSYLCSKLKSYGMVPRKSLVLKFPTVVPKSLMNHFIRGYFDGDGYIAIGSGGHSAFSLVGTFDFCRNVQKIFIDSCGLSKTILEKCGTNTCKLRYGGNIRCTRIFDYLYNNATLYLIRKYDKFIVVQNNKIRDDSNGLHFNTKLVLDTSNNKIYRSLREASEALNINYYALSCSLRGSKVNNTTLIYL